MSQEKSARASSRGWLASVVVLLFAVVLMLGAFWQRQTITDYVLAAQYEAPVAIAEIRDDLKLTDQGMLLFNASQPKLQVADAFNASCQQQKETNNPILGCYVNQRIYIYDVKNQKLDGIEETTAAHELLHAVYERMSYQERTEIDAEIKKVLGTIMTPELKERLEYYRKAEPGEEYNELHAILGTEFPTLGDALERHYQRYFQSRQTVLAYYSKYNSVFESVTTKLEAQLTTINALTQKTNQRVTSFNKKQQVLDQDIAAFNSRANSPGGYGTTTEFQSDRSALEARRQALKAERADIEADIARITRLTEERAKLTEEYNALSQSINSSLAPIPSLGN